MKTLTQRAQATLEQITQGVDDDHTRKLDNTDGTFMPVSVEKIGPSHFSVMHTFVQNGDLMRDPDVEFWKGPDGKFYPLTFRQDSLGIFNEVAVLQGERLVTSSPRLYADLCSFVTTWMKNICFQQGEQLTNGLRGDEEADVA